MEQTLDRLYSNYAYDFSGIGYQVLNIPMHELAERVEHYVKWKAQVSILLQNRGITQRTQEWYLARENLITASDIAQALGKGKFGTAKQFFQKKCGKKEEQTPFDYTIAPLKWGTIYEEVAQSIYSRLNNVQVHEFGLLQHKHIPFVGASPDGITELGVMLEIKCPWKRKIEKGVVPKQYYYQIQGQLDVCDLDECDYFECSIGECTFGPSDHDWNNADAFMRGVFVEMRCTGDVPYKCVYPPTSIHGQTEALVHWSNTFESAYLHWWYVKEINCVRVKRDNEFVREMFDDLGKVWTKVLEYKSDRCKYVSEIGVPNIKAKTTKEYMHVDERETIEMFAGDFMFNEYE
jgi:putative phage-type endonuclease